MLGELVDCCLFWLNYPIQNMTVCFPKCCVVLCCNMFRLVFDLVEIMVPVSMLLYCTETNRNKLKKKTTTSELVRKHQHRFNETKCSTVFS